MYPIARLNQTTTNKQETKSETLGHGFELFKQEFLVVTI